MSCQPGQSAPRGPNSASTPMPATSVGITKGSIKSRNTKRRPRKSKRASAHATGTPESSTSVQVMSACNNVHNSRHCI